MQDFISVGVRYAERGEFTKRALLNGKITLSQAEAVERLASALNPLGVQKAAAALAGRLDSALAEIYNGVIDILADIEANIDFAEDTVDETSLHLDYKERLARVNSELKRYTDRYFSAEGLLRGAKL
jgi:tRNA modification GTPase